VSSSHTAHVNSVGLLLSEGALDGNSESNGEGSLVELGSTVGIMLTEGAGEIVGSIVS